MLIVARGRAEKPMHHHHYWLGAHHASTALRGGVLVSRLAHSALSLSFEVYASERQSMQGDQIHMRVAYVLACGADLFP